MRKLLNRKIVAQDRKCAICQEQFYDYNDIVPDHSVPSSISLPRLRQNVATPSAESNTFVVNRATRARSEIKGNLAAVAFLSLFPRAQGVLSTAKFVDWNAIIDVMRA
jgi:hypothetical protein